jgi:hypothetical protein
MKLVLFTAADVGVNEFTITNLTSELNLETDDVMLSNPVVMNQVAYY